MPIFERGFRTAAKTELERVVRQLEERNKKELAKKEFYKAVETLDANIVFAEKIELISGEEAEAYRERVEQANREYKRIHEVENSFVADGYENPTERSQRCMDMEEAKREIAQQRLKEAENYRNEQARSAQVHTSDEPERAK